MRGLMLAAQLLLALSFVALPAAAQESRNETNVRQATEAPEAASAERKEKDTGVPKNAQEVLAPLTIERLRATLGDVSAEVAVRPGTDLRFVRRSGGKFVELEGAIPYQQPFFLEARIEVNEDGAWSYDVDVSWTGSEGQQVRLMRTFYDSEVYRSGPILLEAPK